MRKTHLTYLKRAVAMALTSTDRSTLLSQLEAVKGASGPVYQLVRDVVCDARFYGVAENTPFWKDYGVAAVSRLIDSMQESGALGDAPATIEKENFLNTWLSDHMIPFSEAERKRIAARLKQMTVGGSLMFENSADGSPLIGSGEFAYGLGVRDKTNDGDEPQPDLPDEAKPLLEGADDVLAGLPGEWELREKEYLRLMHPSLLELARKIGRSGGVAGEVRGKFSHAAKSDITGIMTGADLNRMLPSETALLTSPDTERVFLRRYVEKRLQIFSASSVSTHPEVREKGPVYICIDTSGSMQGEPEMMAKNLALSITLIAQRERRPIFVVNYSHTLSFFVVTDIRSQLKKFLTFLSRSYSGGNDEEKLFRFLFKTLPASPAYRRYASMFHGADLLIVSDFFWDSIGPDTKTLIDHARSGGMKIHTLGIHLTMRSASSGDTVVNSGVESDPQNSEINPQNPTGYRNGYDFFSDSDFRYTYSGGRLHFLP